MDEICKKPLVSVVCLVYNQEEYVKQMIDSILSQQTTFEYEVIINDDASSDRTKEILIEYEKNYENLKVIYQEENLYSRGINPLLTLIENASGKYIAFCEGDDYFTSEKKLQMQFDLLEKTEYVACVHSAIKINEKGIKTGERKPLIQKEELETEDIILCIGQLYALNSLMCRKTAVSDLYKDQVFTQCSVGDIPLALHLAIRGTFFYLQDNLSAYRVQSKGSWTESIKHDRKKHISYLENIIMTLKTFDEETNQRYHNVVCERIKTNTFHLMRDRLDIRGLLSREYRIYFKFIRKRDICDLIFRFVRRLVIKSDE